MFKFDSLKKATPNDVDFPAKTIDSLINELESECEGIHSIAIARHGAIIYENYFEPYSAELTHTLYSLSKSFTSTAIGFAASEGLLTVDDKVASFFPEYDSKIKCDKMFDLTIKNLLTMSTGHTYEPFTIPFNNVHDWVECFLSSDIDKTPGSDGCFLYNTPATYMLSAIITRVTGQNVADYLSDRLFKPLSIDKPYFETCPKGINTGGFGLNLKTLDLLKFGIMLLNRGNYFGKQIISSDWIDEATAKQVNNAGPQDFGKSEWSCGYGYQFWRCSPNGVYRGDGAHGQFIIVIPQHDMVIAMTGGYADMGKPMEVIFKNIIPAVDKADDFKLEAKKLSMYKPQGERDFSAFCGDYSCNHNATGIRSISICDDNGELKIKLMQNNKEYVFNAGFDCFAYGKYVTEAPASIAKSAYAVNGDTLEVMCYMVETPYAYKFIFEKCGDKIKCSRKINVSFLSNEPVEFELLRR